MIRARRLCLIVFLTQVFSLLPHPSSASLSLTNAPATNITATAAWLNGVVTGTNGTTPTVSILYGTSNQSTNLNQWTYTNAVGSVALGASYTAQATNLTESTFYYFRGYAVAGTSTSWTPTASYFWTAASAPSLTSAIPRRSVMVDVDGDVTFPSNFVQRNRIVGMGHMPTNVEDTIKDLAQAEINVEVPDQLDDYYTQTAADTRFGYRWGTTWAEYIVVSNAAWAELNGLTVQDALDRVDALLAEIRSLATNDVASTNVYNTTTAALTNAADIAVAFTPSAYTPAAGNVEEHLRSIDSRLSYLYDAILDIIATPTNPPAPSTNALVSLAISGDATASEGVDEEYTATATLTSGSSNVSAQASWSFVGSKPASVYFLTNLLHIGAFTWDTNIIIKATWSYNGVTKSATKAVSLTDTNPPSLQSVTLVGATSIDEGSSELYTVYAVFPAQTNTVTTNATYGFSGSVPSGTAWSGNRLTAGGVDSNTWILATAQYAHESVIKSATNSIRIRCTDQRLRPTFTYDGAYAAGTLRVEGYDNAAMSGWPTWRYQIEDFPPAGGSLIITTNAASVRVKGSGQYNGQTWWFAWLDSDADGVLCGDLVSSPGSILSVWDAGTIPSGQTASVGITLQTNKVNTMTFALHEALSASSAGKHRFGWRQSDGGGFTRRIIEVYHIAAGVKTKAWRKVLDRRTYICEQDMLLGGFVGGYSYPLPAGNYQIIVGNDINGTGVLNAENAIGNGLYYRP